MKLLVVSDSHGRYESLARVMNMHSDADAVVFLGDGLSDLGRADAGSYPFTVFSVKGNCDGFSLLSHGLDSPEELVFSLGGFRFFAMHGHTRGVKYGYERAINAALEKNADVLLFGHTHRAEEKYLPGQEGGKPLYIFNPGSLGASSDGLAHFGIIEIREKNILFSFGALDK